MEGIVAFLHLIFDNNWFRLIGGLVFLNLASGVAAALTQQTFVLGGLAEWMRTRAVPYIIVDGALQAFFLVAVGGDAGGNGNVLTQSGLSTVLGDGVHALVIAALVAHILSNLKDMGLSAVPDILTNGVTGVIPDTSRTASPDGAPVIVGGRIGRIRKADYNVGSWSRR